MDETITINDFYQDSYGCYFRFSGTGVCHAWLDNVNHHLPNILALNIVGNNQLFLDHESFSSFINKLDCGTVLRLSFSGETKRIYYSVNNKIRNFIYRDKVFFDFHNLSIIKLMIINGKPKKPIIKHAVHDLRNIYYTNKLELTSLPVKVLVIGTCFSRRVFSSDRYFNPDYKKYFKVTRTLFHNSLISLMSNPINCEKYRRIIDLSTRDIYPFVEIEFTKDVKKVLDNACPDIVLIDNYIDATTPLVSIQDSFLTYNKYFSESIYKCNFSGKKLVNPGTELFKSLFLKSIRLLRLELKKRLLLNRVILLGGRLSHYKVDLRTGCLTPWSDKMDWIVTSNRYWDIADDLFMSVFPEAMYIDLRDTKWYSDLFPEIGSASPSHYQTEYYRDILKILKLITIKEELYD